MWICTINGKIFYFVANRTYQLGRSKDNDLFFGEIKYLSRVHVEFKFSSEKSSTTTTPNEIDVSPQTVSITVQGQTGCEVEVFEATKTNIFQQEEQDSSPTTADLDEHENEKLCALCFFFLFFSREEEE